MRRSSIYILAAIALLFASCKKESNTGTVKIKFQPTFGTGNLKMDSTYATPDGKYVNFSSIGLYLSHIKFTKTDNSIVEVDSAVILIYADSAIGFSFSAPAGTYRSVTFGIGLDPTQNRIVPPITYFDPVYSNTDLWWSAPRYHLFEQLEGYSGTSSSLGSIFAYHVGLDSNYHTATVSKSFSVSSGQATSMILNADLEQVYYGPNAINVITQPTTMSDDYPDRAKTIAYAFTQLFSIQ
jgi:hypothetical protein